MAELLVELFSEEIPARMQVRAAEDLGRLFSEKLTAANLAFDRVETHSTPRRLTLVVDGLPTRQPDSREERKGPRVGSPDKAVEGFLRGAGLSSLDECERRDMGKGEFWFAVIDRPGRETVAVLPEILTDVLRDLPWPKSMRWADHGFRWVRPLQAVLAVFDGAPLTGSLSLNGSGEEILFGDRTAGHRFLAPEPVAVANYADYRDELRRRSVMLDRAERKAVIREGLDRLAVAEGLRVAPDEGLLEEVVGLVEWPVPLIGSIDVRFMGLPPEVLTTSMRTHQRYFSLIDDGGALAPRFVVVSNMITADGGKAVVSGNERVLRARLSDAKFFWDQDRKVRLVERVPALENIVFHARLGTVAEKVARLQGLAAEIAAFVPDCDIDRARSAALLAKADLVTGMVGEFPELQGIMGRYYAMGEGEHAAVADAIADHYRPLGPNDTCPTAPVSVAVALADKIDTLVGFFSIDERPTGSKDPYALRRAALGVIRLIVENGLRLPLTDVLRASRRLYTVRDLKSETEVVADLLGFFADRLKVVLRERGVRHDLIDAVFALGGEDDLVRLLARVGALQTFLETEDGANLLVAYRRASNIVRIEEKKDGRLYDQAPDARLLAAGEEAALFDSLETVASASLPLLEGEDFAGCMALLARLRRPVDAFFDGVTVNTDDASLRVNRLALLSRIRGTLNGVADFSRIEG